MGALVVNEPGCSVGVEGECYLVRKAGAVLQRVRRQELEALLLVGRVELSAAATLAALREGIAVAWLSRSGRFLGSLAGPSLEIAERWLCQFRAVTDPELKLRVARSIVAGKIANQRALLLRVQRRARSEAIAGALARMRAARERLEQAADLDAVRGNEGDAAAAYFGVFGQALANPAFTFTGRNRRPPRDPVNACLSFGYAFLASVVEGIVRRHGLLAALGFLHEPSRGRPSLVLDLIEELRPVVVDALVLRLVNKRQVGPGDFEAVDPDDPDGLDLELGEALGPGADEPARARERPAVYLGATARRIFIRAWLARLREPITSRQHEGQTTVQRAIELQVEHLVRVVEGTDAEYVPLQAG
jgi:CRISP-associated protein Cas1